MSDIKQSLAGSLKQGSYVLFDNIPCTVKSVQISKTGKHGHAKCRIEAIGIINNQKIIKIMPAHDKVDVPIIEKKSAQILSISEDTANVMDMETYETFEMPIPEEFKGQLEPGKEIQYLQALGRKKITRT